MKYLAQQDSTDQGGHSAAFSFEQGGEHRMPYVAVSQSPIHVRHTGEGGHPDNSLPGDQPGIDNTLPAPPPLCWPPPTISHPIVPIPPGTSVPPGTIWPSPGHPGQPLPPFPGRPDQGLPERPGRPGRPDNTLPGGGEVDNTLPGQPPRPDQGLPSQCFWVVVGIPGYGWRYVCVDPSLSVGYPLPGGPPGHADNTLPPAAQPKT